MAVIPGQRPGEAVNVNAHVAQRNFSPARSVAADGYLKAIADVGICNPSTRLPQHAVRAVEGPGADTATSPRPHCRRCATSVACREGKRRRQGR